MTTLTRGAAVPWIVICVLALCAPAMGQVDPHQDAQLWPDRYPGLSASDGDDDDDDDDDCAPRPDDNDCFGSVVSMTLRYTGRGCGATTQDQNGQLQCAGDADQVQPVRFRVTDGLGKMVYADQPGMFIGDTIELSARGAREGTLRDRTRIVIDDDLEVSEFETSCSQPLRAGDEIGSAQIVSLRTTEGGSDTFAGDDRDCLIARASVDLLTETMRLEGDFCANPNVSVGTAEGNLVPVTIDESEEPIKVSLAPVTGTLSDTFVVVVECPCETCEMDVTITPPPIDVYCPPGECLTKIAATGEETCAPCGTSIDVCCDEGMCLQKITATGEEICAPCGPPTVVECEPGMCLTAIDDVMGTQACIPCTTTPVSCDPGDCLTLVDAATGMKACMPCTTIPVTCPMNQCLRDVDAATGMKVCVPCVATPPVPVSCDPGECLTLVDVATGMKACMPCTTIPVTCPMNQCLRDVDAATGMKVCVPCVATPPVPVSCDPGECLSAVDVATGTRTCVPCDTSTPGECPQSPTLTVPIARWCVDRDLRSPANFVDAMTTCALESRSVCAVEALLACDVLGSLANESSCRIVTDTPDGRLWTGTYDAAFDERVFQGIAVYGGDEVIRRGTANEVYPYFCCVERFGRP